jgi:hypothetical protein
MSSNTIRSSKPGGQMTKEYFPPTYLVNETEYFVDNQLFYLRQKSACPHRLNECRTKTGLLDK